MTDDLDRLAKSQIRAAHSILTAKALPALAPTADDVVAARDAVEVAAALLLDALDALGPGR